MVRAGGEREALTFVDHEVQKDNRMEKENKDGTSTSTNIDKIETRIG